MNRFGILAGKRQYTGTRVPDLVAELANIVVPGAEARVGCDGALGMIGQTDVEFHEQFVLAPSQAMVRETGVVEFGVMMKRAAWRPRCGPLAHRHATFASGETGARLNRSPP